MISSFVRALVSAFKARRELRVRGYVAWLRGGQCVRITNSKQRKHLSPSARCAPVNGLAGCYVSTIGTPHEYFDLTGKGRCIDNVFIERLWRSLKYEDVYLNDYDNPVDARGGIDRYLGFLQRPA